MDNLKPCPFCGTTELYEYPDGDMEGHSVMGDHDPDCLFGVFFGHTTWEEAVTAWNKRPREFFLEAELVQCYHTIQFMHGCLTDKHYKYEYPEHTQQHLDDIKKLVDIPKLCHHSIHEPTCEACVRTLKWRIQRAEYQQS